VSTSGGSPPATYNHKLGDGNRQTRSPGATHRPGHTLDAVLLETAASFGRHTLFARAEAVQKDELFTAPSPLAGQVFRVSAFSLGYVYDFPIAKHLAIGPGVVGTAYALPSAIRPAYGSGPLSVMAFLRLKIR
jgi:hypothetical protein